MDDPPPTLEYARPPARRGSDPYVVPTLIGLGVGLLVGGFIGTDGCGVVLFAAYGGFKIGSAAGRRAPTRPYLPGLWGNFVATTTAVAGCVVVTKLGFSRTGIGIEFLVVTAALMLTFGLLGGFVGSTGKRLDND